MDKIFKLARCVKFLRSDANKFFTKNNHTAGVRLRKELQKCKRISNTIRKLVQFVKSKYRQKKVKIKAARAACLGKTILEDKKFQIDCLRGRELINIENQNFEKYFFENTANELEFEKKIPFNYDFDRLFNLENITPIPSYSIFNFNP